MSAPPTARGELIPPARENPSPSPRPARLDRLDFLPFALYVVAAVLARAAGLRMTVYPALVPLVDTGELTAHPLRSLLLLHAQPPGFNAAMALLLRTSAATGVEPARLAQLLFWGLGAAGAWLVFRLTWSISGSRGLAFAAVVLVLADPGFHYFGSVFFYPLPLFAMLLAALYAADRWWAGGPASGAWALALAGLLAALTLTRTLYAPPWSLAVFALATAAAARLGALAGHRERRQAVAAAALLVALLAAWPLKNLLVFGHATYTSWTGYNLARGLPAMDPALARFIESGEVTAELEGRWRREAPGWAVDQPVVASPLKNSTNRNWNHYVFLLTSRDLAGRALGWLLDHPGDWALRTAAQYFMWCQPTYTEPYWGTHRGPEDHRWLAWASAYRDLLFFDLRPAVERRFPDWPLHGRAEVQRRAIPYTAFALFGLPLVVGAAAATLWRRRRRFERAEWTALLAGFTLLWTLAVPCLTDGIEGNRIRFSSSSTLILLAVYAAGRLLDTRRRRARLAGGPH